MTTSTAAFTCPKCSYRFRVKDKYLGQIAECPAAGCTQKMRLNPPTVSGTMSASAEVERHREDAASSQGASRAPLADDSSSNAAAVEVTENPVVHQMNDADQGSVISVIAMTPAESRRTQRALRRRATTAPPKVEVQKKPIDPAWIGFGAVLVIATIGWIAWAFVGEPETIETKIPAADESLPIRVEGVDEQVSIARPQPIYASLQNSPHSQSGDSLKKKYSRI